MASDTRRAARPVLRAACVAVAVAAAAIPAAAFSPSAAAPLLRTALPRARAAPAPPRAVPARPRGAPRLQPLRMAGAGGQAVELDSAGFDAGDADPIGSIAALDEVSAAPSRRARRGRRLARFRARG